MRHLFAVSAEWIDRLWEVGRELLLVALPALGTALVALVRRRRRRAAHEAAERERFRLVLMATARVVQILLEESIARDQMTSTGRIRPMTDREIAARAGGALERKRHAAEALRDALGLEDDTREQDVFAPEEMGSDE